jgi:putative transposase
MPEHVHLLVHPTTPDYQISAFLASVKIRVVRQAVAFVREHSPDFLARMTDRLPNGKTSLRFWMRGGGYDRNLWEPRYVWEMIDYIHANPVRRGLCDRPEDWPWSSSRQYRGFEAESLKIDRESLPEDPRK